MFTIWGCDEIRRKIVKIRVLPMCVVPIKQELFLAFFVAGIIPFIVELVLSDSGLSVYDWFSKGSREVDFFLIWKKWWLIGTAAIMLVLMLARAARSFFCKNEPAWKREINRSFSYNRWIIVCSVLYIVTALISSCMAENKEYAFWGGYTNHQPFFVLASYVIVMIFTYFYVNSKEAILSFYKLFMAAVFIMALLGVFQFFGHDFFASMAGKRIITFFSDIDPTGVTLKFGEGRVYLTLYNPDYVGTYVKHGPAPCMRWPVDNEKYLLEMHVTAYKSDARGVPYRVSINYWYDCTYNYGHHGIFY